MNLFRRIFGRSEPAQVDVEAVAAKLNDSSDPLDIVARGAGQFWPEESEDSKPKFEFRSVTEFPLAIVNIEADDGLVYVGDSKSVIEGTAMDATCAPPSVVGFGNNAYAVNPALASWYNSQGFIGYQMCAILAQHWLVDKACSQSVEDAVRNGWTYKPDSGVKLTDEQRDRIDKLDLGLKIKETMMEAGRFTNIFGIRVLIYVVESTDPEYYSKPFNPDGIKKGSYKGVSQIDPYWMTPMLTNESMQNPAAINFYEPDYWVINGKRYHHSHLIILRGPQPADILKPTYIFGGVPLTQRIYERVYAAERTANEAPLLAMNKRTTAIHTDLDKVAKNEHSFMQKILMWVRFRDNHAVKILGKEETMEQFDTSLADFDSVIMNQYQIVAAQSKTPATKLLGTSPKGFNATGEFETVSYHEELESIQERWCDPIIERHYLCMCVSEGWDFRLKVTWEPVDSMTASQQADINNKKVNDAVQLVTIGSISPDEARDKIINDKDSGWNNLNKDDDAETEQGASPENIAELEKAGAEQVTATASAEEDSDVAGPYKPQLLARPVESRQEQVLNAILHRLEKIEHATLPDGYDNVPQPTRMVNGLKPSTVGADATTQGIGSIVPPLPDGKLPRMKVHGMVCSIENPRNSIRRGVSLDGHWAIKMPHHYGFINNTMGADGDEVDCFIGPNPASPRIFVINQKDVNTGDFDEHKAMIGFDSADEAKAAYYASYSEDWDGFDGIVEMSPDAFRSWVSQSSNENPLDSAAIGYETNSAPQEPGL